jgi:hypothetical protein
MIDDILVRVSGYKPLIGQKYKVLSITLTDLYLQNEFTKKCTNTPIRFVLQDYRKFKQTVMKGGEK